MKKYVTSSTIASAVAEQAEHSHKWICDIEIMTVKDFIKLIQKHEREEYF